jgi:8-oxo-dGTP pyrophosphatase MutT (NUDIX family)
LVAPRESATIIVLAGSEPFSVLMVKRPPGGLFGDAWVFPGGLVDEVDADSDDRHRQAAVRELKEEVGLEIEASKLAHLSRWITPEGLPRRYDTWFFLAALREPVEVAPLSAEIVEATFVSPSTALAAHQAHQWKLVLPTLTHLRWLSRYRSVEAALAAAPARSSDPIEPRLAGDGSVVELDLPW